MGMTTKTKTPKMLTVTQATVQARRLVDRFMPGVMATVDSKLSHDLATDTPTVITTVTFPEYLSVDGHTNIGVLSDGLDTLAGSRGVDVSPTRVIVTRER